MTPASWLIVAAIVAAATGGFAAGHFVRMILQ